uniref:choice-of-anchor J domain-containing protein n=1 Tax=Lentimicrobium sp. TaxID=2034841 RepID=UPI002CA40937
QWPPTATIALTENVSVYAQCWEPGVTPGAGPGVGIECWIGISSSDTDPSTWDYWVPAAYNTGFDPGSNNDEYFAEIGNAQGIPPGTYYYASRFRYLGGPFTYGGIGGPWDGTTNVSGILTVTPCNAYSVPFSEDFEESSPNLGCWLTYNADEGGTAWTLSNIYNNTPGGQRSALHSYGDIGYDEDGWLVSPPVSIPSSGQIDLAFWSYNEFPDDYGKNSVLISTGSGNPDDGEFVEIWSPASVTDAWTETILSLVAYAGQDIFIAFRYEGNYAHEWYLDDVFVGTLAPPVKTLNLKAYIQGFWNGSAMNQAQDVDQDENIFNKFSGTTVDTLSVYLAEADAPWAYLFAAHEVNINTDGSMVISVPAAFSGSYYIVIDHHSSVETWSALPVDFSGTTIDYDFTTAAEQAYGSNQKSMGTVWALYSGDVNDDEYIEFLDVVPIYNLSTTGFFGYSLFDIDGSGYIEFFDYIMANNNSIIGAGMNTPPNPGKRPGLLKPRLTD